MDEQEQPSCQYDFVHVFNGIVNYVCTLYCICVFRWVTIAYLSAKGKLFLLKQRLLFYMLRLDFAEQKFYDKIGPIHNPIIHVFVNKRNIYIPDVYENHTLAL